MTDLTAPIAFILATIGAIIAAAMSARHAFGMFTGTKRSSNAVSQLLPFVYFALPGTLDTNGQAHRTKFFRWLLVLAACILAALLIQFFFRP